MTCASLRAESQLSTHDAAPRASLTLKGQFFPYFYWACRAAWLGGFGDGFLLN